MDELCSYLLERKKDKGYLFIPYLLLGDPNYDISLKIAKALIECGADSIEFGLPFSDPSADGVVLQKAFQRVLAKEFSMKKIEDFLSKISAYAPKHYFVIMGYANLFYQNGFSRLFQNLYEKQVRGVVIPDIPVEEKIFLKKEFHLKNYQNQIAWIDFITPTTTEKRLQKILKQAQGFLYIVSYKGTTGALGASLEDAKKLLMKVRKKTTLPCIVGFGIRSRQQVEEILPIADGFIIGSRIHEIIEQNLENENSIPEKIFSEIKNILPEKMVPLK